MNRVFNASRRIISAATIAVVAFAAVRSACADVELDASWQAPSYDDVREDVLSWLDESDAPTAIARQVRELWPSEAPAAESEISLLDRLVDTLAVAWPEAGELRERCQSGYVGPQPPRAAWLNESELPALARDNLRLYYARWLAQHGLYDEVLEQVADLRPADVVDPASLLFYQMAAYHQLVRPDDARVALVQLLEREEQLPRRFQQVAQLVSRDLAALEDESLDHIARRMNDIRRRLNYGRAGAKVQEIEEGVVKSLDKKIEDMEKECQKQQASISAGAPQSSKPMDDSRPAELKGAMQVDRKDIGHQSGWGDLPPKERQQALQQIGREFPAHYRELIEQYFRELANEETVAGGSN
jgi:hypothetical protein